MEDVTQGAETKKQKPLVVQIQYGVRPRRPVHQPAADRCTKTGAPLRPRPAKQSSFSAASELLPAQIASTLPPPPGPMERGRVPVVRRNPPRPPAVALGLHPIIPAEALAPEIDLQNGIRSESCHANGNV